MLSAEIELGLVQRGHAPARNRGDVCRQLDERHGFRMRLPCELVLRHPLEDSTRDSHLMIELREQRVDDTHNQLVPFPKFTFGTCSAAVGALKSGYSLKPKTLAVTFAGNCRRAVLYSCTRSL